MTYTRFLAIFLVIPILAAAGLNWLDYRKKKKLPDDSHFVPFWVSLVVHISVAVIYTTPWDNYLVATGVWYYDPALVTGVKIGWVPVEEYSFFVLQTLLAGLWLLWLARQLTSQERIKLSNGNQLRAYTALITGLAWLAATGLLFWGGPSTIYLGLILFWGLPPFMLQLAFGADILWMHRRLAALTLIPVTLYLAATDSLAIAAGTWKINPMQSLNVFLPGGLPLEEFIFFWVTNTLVVLGMILLLSTESRERAVQLKALLLRKYFRGKLVITPGEMDP